MLLGDKVNENNKYWKLLIKLSEIIHLLYKEDIDEADCNKLEKLIISHHSYYKLLYPEKSLKKKHHNMLHYPTAIRKIGSLVDYCTLRFEGKHTFFKTAQRTSHNYKNIPKTVTKKHQISFANNLMNSNLLNKECLVIDGKEISVKNLNTSVRICLAEIVDVSEDDQITIANEIEYYGQNLKKNHVVSRLKNLKVWFYKIMYIVEYKVNLELSNF